MTNARATLGFALVAIAASACTRQLPEGSMDETVIYVASKVRTLAHDRPVVGAIAVHRGKIVAAGTRDEVVDASPKNARVVDLGAATIVPGLVDSHAHLSSLGRGLTVTRLKGTRSVEEIIARLKAAPAESWQGDWLIGRGWDQNDWAEGKREFPTARELDAAFPRTPVFLTRVDGHAAWVSSEALLRAGITRETRDPPGGRIERDATGAPTGVLIDNAIELVSAKMPELTDEQLQKRLVAAIRKAAEVGLTGIHDAGMDLRTFEQLQRWDAIGQLPLRIYAMADGQGKDADAFLERGTFGGVMLTMRSVKFLADGALGSRGAALHEPYSDDPHNRGLLLLTPEELEAKARAFMERGFQVNVHAIGDRANTLVLDILDRASKATSTTNGRHRLEHAQIMRLDDIPRLRELGVIASMQPTHATSDMPWAEARVGPLRIKGAYAWRSIIDSGAIVAFGSDFPVEDPEPLAGLYSARTRQDWNGNPEGGWYPEQRITGEEALRAFTVGGAYASFSENQRGTLERGMDADFVVLSVDPVDAPASELIGAKVLMTVVAGRPVYDASVAQKP